MNWCYMKQYDSFNDLYRNCSGPSEMSFFNNFDNVKEAADRANSQLVILRAARVNKLNAYNEYMRLRNSKSGVGSFEVRQVREANDVCSAESAKMQEKITDLKNEISKEYTEISEIRQTDESSARARLTNVVRLQKKLAKSKLGNENVLWDMRFSSVALPSELQDLLPARSANTSVSNR